MKLLRFFCIYFSLLMATSISHAQCLNFTFGPWDGMNSYFGGSAPCGESCQTLVNNFGIWPSEAYYFLDMPPGATYTFDACEGYNADLNWEAEITVAEFDGEKAIEGSLIDFSIGCQIVFTVPNSNTTPVDIIIIVNDHNDCIAESMGEAAEQGVLSFSCSSATAPCFDSTAPPSLATNNECIDAVALDLPSTIDESIQNGPFNNINATSEDSDPSVEALNNPDELCFFEQSYDETLEILNNTLWYTLVGDGSSYRIVTSDCDGTLGDNYITDGDTQMAIYTGACDDFALLLCNEDGPTQTIDDYASGVELVTEEGTTYFIMIDGFNLEGTVATGAYCMDITQIPPPVEPPIPSTPPDNNECTEATQLGLPDEVGEIIAYGPFDNSEATSEASDIEFTNLTGDETNMAGDQCCACETESGTDENDLHNTLWFKFTPGSTGIYLVEAIAQSSENGCEAVLGETEDTQLFIYSSEDGTCNTLGLVECNEDGPSASSSNYPAGASVTLMAGTTYYLIVDGF